MHYYLKEDVVLRGATKSSQELDIYDWNARRWKPYVFNRSSLEFVKDLTPAEAREALTDNGASATEAQQAVP